MKIIKRYDLEIEPIQKILVPFNAEIIHFNVFNKIPAFWAEVDEAGRMMERTFFIVADGKELPQGLNKTKHIGSFEHKAQVGQHMMHVYSGD